MNLRTINNNFLFKNSKNFLTIKLTIKQFLYFGLHLGHLVKNTEFLSAWLFYGWRKNVFIINLIKTIFLLKIGLKMIKHVIKLKLPFFFISMNYIYGPYLGRYALLCGESFNIYSWVSGFLSNFRFVSSWYSLIFNISKRNQYKLRYKDKKLLSSYYGLNSFLKLGRRKTKKDMFIPVSYYNSNKFQNNLKFYLKNETRNIKKKFNMVKFNKYWKFSTFLKEIMHRFKYKQAKLNFRKFLGDEFFFNFYNQLKKKLKEKNLNKFNKFIFRTRNIFLKNITGNNKLLLLLYKKFNNYLKVEKEKFNKLRRKKEKFFLKLRKSKIEYSNKKKYRKDVDKWFKPVKRKDYAKIRRRSKLRFIFKKKNKKFKLKLKHFKVFNFFFLLDFFNKKDALFFKSDKNKFRKNLFNYLNFSLKNKINLKKDIKFYRKLQIENKELLDKKVNSYITSRSLFYLRNKFLLEKKFFYKKWVYSNWFIMLGSIKKKIKLKKTKLKKIYIKKQFKKRLLFNFFNVKKHSLLSKKLNYLYFYHNDIYEKIILNLKFLHSRINWENLDYCIVSKKKNFINYFFKKYTKDQHRIVNYFARKVNFKYINFFLKNENILKKKQKFYLNLNKILFNLNKSDFNLKNKLIIFKFIFKLDKYFRFKNEKDKINFLNFKINFLNQKKNIQKKVILNLFLKKKMQNNLKFLQPFFKKKKKKKLQFKIFKNVFKKKKFFQIQYLFKQFNLIDNDEKKSFLKFFFYKKKKKKLLDFLKVHRLKKYKALNLKKRKKNKFHVNFPGGGFLPTILDNVNIIDEFRVNKVPFISLVDSNVRSVGIFIPIPSNDDSLQCINFFLYLISKTILEKKAISFIFFKKKIKKINFQILKYKFIFLKNLKKINYNKELMQIYLNIFKSNAFEKNRFNYLNLFLDNEGILALIKKKENLKIINWYKI